MSECKWGGKAGGMCLALGAAAAVAMPVAADPLSDALTGGKVSLDVRYRYETVSQDNALKDATASTLRTRLGYMSGAVSGVSGFIEFEDVTAVGDEDYNSTVNGKTQYATVADPVGTEVNQAWLAIESLPATTIKYGRQRIVLDNHRFIGNVGWRQNEQTFDALSVVNKSLANTTITYAWLYNVNRINFSNADMSSHLLNVNYAGWAAGALTGYAYMLDYNDTPASSSQTLGARFSGGIAIGEGNKLLYTAEYAQQSDYGDNPASFDLNYWLLEAGGMTHGVTAKLGYEVLEGNGTVAVQTPLATLHAFNGWADQFLATPGDGLKDMYLSVGGEVMGVGLLAVYHDYETDNKGTDAGSEWNLQAVKKIGKPYALTVKYAKYEAGDLAGKVDTDKLWLMGEVKI